MNGAYLAAGVMSLVGAAIHGGLGEAMIVRRIDAERLPGTRWGGPPGTLLFIRATWHIVTIAFVASGTALSVCAGGGLGRACTGVGMLSAGLYAGFAAIVLGFSIARNPRMLIRHPAPLMLSAVAVLSWLGARY
jgi:hypothetical protein